MKSKPVSTRSERILEAKILVAVAKELQVVADEARERARAACERANTMPLFDGLKNKGGN